MNISIWLTYFLSMLCVILSHDGGDADIIICHLFSNDVLLSYRMIEVMLT